jgi:hypothetical protein
MVQANANEIDRGLETFCSHPVGDVDRRIADPDAFAFRIDRGNLTFVGTEIVLKLILFPKLPCPNGV